MGNGGGWFEKLLQGCILVTGCYIIYRGGTILAETGYLGSILSSDPVVSVVQETVLNTYLPGYPHVLEELPQDGALAEWLEQLIPILKNWYKQGLEQEARQEELRISEAGETDPEEAKKGSEPETDEQTAFGEERDPKSQETEETEGYQEVLAGGAGPEETLLMDQLADFDYLLNHYFVIDQDTTADETLLDAERFLSYDLKLVQEPEVPQILIYHTHSQETFLDSEPGAKEDTILGMGEYLKELLEGYGYQVIHDTGVYDLVNGVLDRSAAYDYARTAVEKILEEHPTIEVIIDLHRGGRRTFCDRDRWKTSLPDHVFQWDLPKQQWPAHRLSVQSLYSGESGVFFSDAAGSRKKISRFYPEYLSERSALQPSSAATLPVDRGWHSVEYSGGGAQCHGASGAASP